jgi:hypothetical protein
MCLFFLLEKSFAQQDSLLEKVLHKIFEAMHRFRLD